MSKINIIICAASLSVSCNFYESTRPGEWYYGYWTALRRSVYATDQATCMNTPLIWVKDNTTSGQYNISASWLATWQRSSNGLLLDCSYNYPTALYPIDGCIAICIPWPHPGIAVDSCCWWPQCPLCQLDAD